MGSGHHHHHHHHFDTTSQKLFWAVAINVLLTVVQLVGGLLSGSLALIADALHNFSDAGALLIAAFARRIAKKPATGKMTFGYKRAEILGALINSSTLLLIGFYLIYEATTRFLDPQPVQGWTIIWVAGVALLVDLVTALLTYKGAKKNINIRAAFIHNLSDAMASVVVIIAGLFILWFEVYWIDLVATFLISAYIIFHAFALIKQCVSILMQSAPEGIDLDEVRTQLLEEVEIEDLHHIHLWQLDDQSVHFEGHVVVKESELPNIESIKSSIRSILSQKFEISHSTLEIEIPSPSKECTQKNKDEEV